MLKFELVVPAYNEVQSLQALIDRTIEAAQNAGFSPQTFQLVIVDNGSNDGTDLFLHSKSETFARQWYRVVTEQPNRGYGAGLHAGLITTHAPIVGYTHADLQCDPNDAFRAYALCLAAGSKSLVRGLREGRALRERFVSKTFALCVRGLLNLPLDEINAQPKIFCRSLLPQLRSAPSDFAFDLFLLYQAARANYKFATLPVMFPPREHGNSKWASTLPARLKTFSKMICYIKNVRQEYGAL